jgi:hypothetical protein
MDEHSSTQHKLLSWNASLDERSVSDVEDIAGEVESTRQAMK